MEGVAATLDPQVSAVERTLAQCERTHPVLRCFQVTIEVFPPSPEDPPGYVFLPAGRPQPGQRMPRGRVLLSLATGGRVRFVQTPGNLTPGQQQALGALEDALVAALRKAPKAPKPGAEEN